MNQNRLRLPDELFGGLAVHVVLEPDHQFELASHIGLLTGKAPYYYDVPLEVRINGM